ncbi:hypothetical protein NSQ95_14720 [Psychrobacillus sp. FSL W7-1457]|uniref:hypothetical protein n=1 Tax=unclassified Psychrobacillus TaxID=2636677 RepID=UPI0030F96016
MSRYISMGILIFFGSLMLGYGLLAFAQVTLDAILIGTILIIAMLSIIITLLIKIYELLKNQNNFRI